MALVPIPWQPHLYLTPDTLALLVKASKLRGRNLYLVGDDAAWRPYEVQRKYFLAWLAYKKYKAGGSYAPKANPASNPDTGMRQHLRGAAFDLRDTDIATQAACRAAGLVRDADESWHWNNPRWASMPIIKTRTETAAGNNYTQIEDDFMSALTDQQQTDLYNAVMHLKTAGIVPGQSYSWAQAANNNTQEIKDALLKPSPYTGNVYRPIDVLLSNATATTDAINKLEDSDNGAADNIDTAPILAAIAALPDAVRAALKNAL